MDLMGIIATFILSHVIPFSVSEIPTQKPNELRAADARVAEDPIPRRGDQRCQVVQQGSMAPGELGEMPGNRMV